MHDPADSRGRDPAAGGVIEAQSIRGNPIDNRIASVRKIQLARYFHE